MKSYVKLMRPQHWVKNVLIFLPVFFNGSVFKGNVMGKLFLGFLAFSLCASLIYVINDICDVEKDRMHEKKKYRPIASGEVSIPAAVVFAVVLGVCSELFLYLADGIKSGANVCLILYLVLNIAYSSGLKNRPIIDIMLLASGFVIRVLFGAQISNVVPSQWLILTIMMFSLYMGLGKRRNEWRKSTELGTETRAVLKYYTYELLNRYMLVSMVLGLVFYAYWCAGITASTLMIWTLPLVIAILMKYEMIIETDSYGDPVDVLLSDKYLIALVLLYVILICLFMYVI